MDNMNSPLQAMTLQPSLQPTEGERLARIEAEIQYIRDRMDEVVISQLKDHGKRIGSLEKRGTYIAGWVAGAMAFGSVLGAAVSLAIRVVYGS